MSEVPLYRRDVGWSCEYPNHGAGEVALAGREEDHGPTQIYAISSLRIMLKTAYTHFP